MVYAKVMKVVRDSGNLNIKVKFFNDDKELKEDDYYIAENGIEYSVLQKYVQKEIKELKERLVSTLITVDDIITETS